MAAGSQLSGRSPSTRETPPRRAIIIAGKWWPTKRTKVSRFALYWYADEPGKVYLSNLFVPEDQRGKGKGSKTLETAIRAAVLLGAEWLYLRPASAEVVAWYIHRGFQPCNKDSFWLRRRIAPAKSPEVASSLRDKTGRLYEDIDTPIQHYSEEHFDYDSEWDSLTPKEGRPFGPADLEDAILFGYNLNPKHE